MKKIEFTAKIDDQDVKLMVVPVTSDVQLSSQKYYSKALMGAINDGMMLMAEVENILRKRDLLDPEKNREETTALNKSIREKEKDLRGAKREGRRMTKEEGKELALSIRRDRLKLREIGQSVSSLLSNTAENYADNERMQYWIYRCTLKLDTQDNYWHSYEEFKSDTSEAVTLAVTNFLQLMMGLDKDYEKKLYENEWLRRMGFTNEDGHLINEQGKLVDDKGRLVNDDGRWVNEKGEFLDTFGNIVDENGQLQSNDGWLPEKPSEPVKVAVVAESPQNTP